MGLEWLNRLPLACNTTANQTANWSFGEWVEGRSPIDFGTCVFECVSYEAFWIIGIIIIINAIFCNSQLNGFKKSNEEPPTNTGDSYLPTFDSNPAPKQNGPCWMQRHLKSRPWLVLVINLCFLIVILVMLEGFPVLLTAWRFSIFFIQLTFPAWEPRALAFLAYSPLSLIILLGWVGVFCAGHFLLKVQFGLMSELISLYCENPKKGVKIEDMELGDLADEEEDDVRPPAYEGWQRAELRVL
ncbi:hypothetical protein NCS57_01417600 [Fusarium keratoplasticum]|uniref:Uncharacterized protein n=1 Tax=Fusarium keratoplasticum TaxID=1328300 RepID=A0ACC0QEW0_9HYPO|nr:hypothetical protein NCS57_01417600 [Fusarium keratoplasticum]KAI8650827.1 hypothetical protein NCS57_01417600 [Fusarium keratoplasticum]